jgi:hypothetical protein
MTFEVMRRWLRTMLALAPPVTTAIALSIVGLVAVRALVPLEILRPANNEAGNYLQTLGTIYAVLLAFVVFTVWSQFNEARTLIEREANELVDLHRAASGLAAADGAPIQADVEEYVAVVLDREWPAMARGGGAELEDGGRVLDRMWGHIVAVEPGTECHRSIFDEILHRFNDLSDVRTQRLSSSRTRIPLGLRMLLYAGAVILVASMYLLAVDSFAVHALMTGALAGAVSHVLYVVADLDSAFSGDWQVPREAFERVARWIRREPS